MVERLLVDLGVDRHVSVSPRVDGRLHITATETASLGSCWTRPESEDLRRYLEGLPACAAGRLQGRGRLIAERLPEWAKGPNSASRVLPWCRLPGKRSAAGRSCQYKTGGETRALRERGLLRPLVRMRPALI